MSRWNSGVRSRRSGQELAKSRARAWFCGVGLRKTDTSGSISGGNSADHSTYCYLKSENLWVASENVNCDVVENEKKA